MVGQVLDLQLRKPREVRQRDEARAAPQVKPLQPRALAQPLRQRDEGRAADQDKRLQRLQFAQPLRQRGQASWTPNLRRS